MLPYYASAKDGSGTTGPYCPDCARHLEDDVGPILGVGRPGVGLPDNGPTGK